MGKPEPFDLNYLTKLHREEFVKFELWISDGLTDHLIRSNDLDSSYTTVVVDMDEDEPLGDNGKVRLNGRFYIPSTDKKGVELNLQPSDWVDLANEWFEENELEVTMDEDPKDLVKFTVFMDGITVPGGGETGDEEVSDEEDSGEEVSDEEDSGEEVGDEEAGEVADEGEASEPSDEGEADTEGPPGDDEEGLKEFEKSLGL